MGSPLGLTVRPGVSPRSSNISGDGTVEAHVGQPAEVVLRLMMHSHVPGASRPSPIFTAFCSATPGLPDCASGREREAAGGCCEAGGG